MENNLLTVTVIGIGSMAQTIHLPMIKAFGNKLKLDLLVDPYLEEKELKRLAEVFNCKYSRNIKDVNSDIAIIVTPISNHFETAEYVINSCKYLLIEKAVTTTVQNISQLIAATRSNPGKRIFVAHMRRFYKNANIAKKIISNDFLGEIEEVKIYEGNLYGWNRKYFSNDKKTKAIDEGVLFDVGSHSIDLFTFIFSDVLNEVMVGTCTVDKLELFSNIFFSGQASITSKKKVLHFVAAFSNTTALNNGMLIKGTKANLFIPPKDSIRPKLISKLNREMIELDINYEAGNPFYLMYDNILNSIYNDAKSILDIENFSTTTKILEDAFIKAVEGKIDWLD